MGVEMRFTKLEPLGEAVDLDLDVMRLRDGSVRVLDEDEFADHRAQASCDELVRRITSGEEPFVRVAAGWLAEFAQS
jgi:protein associated with RNAse G/E